MRSSAGQQSSFQQYLLGQLSESDRDAFCDALAHDESLMQELKEFETDWIDRLARRELPPQEAQQLLQYLEATGQQHRLDFAEALVAYPSLPATNAAQPRAWSSQRWLRPLAVAAILSFVFIGIQTYRNHAPEPTDSRNGPSVPTPEPYRVELSAEITRGAHTPSPLVVPENVETLRLVLHIPEGRHFPSYRVQLLGSNDQAEWQTTLAPQDASPSTLELDISTSLLSLKRRELSLAGIDDNGAEQLLTYYQLQINTEPRAGN